MPGKNARNLDRMLLNEVAYVGPDAIVYESSSDKFYVLNDALCQDEPFERKVGILKNQSDEIILFLDKEILKYIETVDMVNHGKYRVVEEPWNTFPERYENSVGIPGFKTVSESLEKSIDQLKKDISEEGLDLDIFENEEDIIKKKTEERYEKVNNSETHDNPATLKGIGKIVIKEYSRGERDLVVLINLDKYLDLQRFGKLENHQITYPVKFHEGSVKVNVTFLPILPEWESILEIELTDVKYWGVSKKPLAEIKELLPYGNKA